MDIHIHMHRAAVRDAGLNVNLDISHYRLLLQRIRATKMKAASYETSGGDEIVVKPDGSWYGQNTRSSRMGSGIGESDLTRWLSRPKE